MTVDPQTVDETLTWGRERLAGTDEAELAASMLLAHVRECTLSELFVYPDRRLGAQQRAAYRALVERRARNEPVAYLIGHRGFLELDLLVDPRVLIPRPETELLVERALSWAQRYEALRSGHRDAPPTVVDRSIQREGGGGIPMPSKETFLRIADVGTGSGAIAVGLAVALPQAAIYALDSSPDALEVARQNAARCGVKERITFLEGDLLSPLTGERAAVDLIVANLPYVTEDEYAELPPGIRDYEPRAALIAGPDGLDAIRRLLHSARPHLASGGAILLEIGAAQGAAISALAEKAFPEARVEAISDYGGRDRVVEIDTSK
jgi:release factor glutamine methyltransferase